LAMLLLTVESAWRYSCVAPAPIDRISAIAPSFKKCY
jgi:hypothetical protein